MLFINKQNDKDKRGRKLNTLDNFSVKHGNNKNDLDVLI